MSRDSHINTKLYDELLMTVFEHVADTSGTPVERLDSAVALSHVCCRWRSIALDMGSLWTTFTSQRSNSTLMPAQVTRVGHQPLTVDWNLKGDHKRRQEALDVLMAMWTNFAEQVHDVRFEFRRDDLALILRLFLSTSTRLTSIHLRGDRGEDLSEFAQQRLTAFSYVDPSELELWATLPTYHPNLRSLTLHDISWFDSETTWPLLQNLEVVSPPADIGDVDEKLNLEPILDRLSRLPRLASLKLHAVDRYTLDDDNLPLTQDELLDTPPGGLPCSAPRLVFPDLRTLDIAFWDLRSAVELCRCISVHPACSLRFTLEEAHDHPELTTALLIKHLFPREAAHRMVHTFEYKEPEAWGCLSAGSFVITGTGRAADEAEVKTQMTLDGKDVPIDHFPAAALAAWNLFDLADLRSLSIRVNHEPPGPYPWERLFNACATVEVLHLQGSVISAFLDLSEHGLEQDQDPPCVCFPRIYSLQLSELRGAVCDYSEVRLEDILRQRKTAGFGPQEVLRNWAVGLSGQTSELPRTAADE